MCILDIEETKDEKYRRTVNAFVREIGIRHSLQGYYDIQEAICFGLECQEDIVPKMRTIYEAIALKHNVGYQCVERNIRHAINDAYMILADGEPCFPRRRAVNAHLSACSAPSCAYDVPLR